MLLICFKHPLPLCPSILLSFLSQDKPNLTLAINHSLILKPSDTIKLRFVAANLVTSTLSSSKKALLLPDSRSSSYSSVLSLLLDLLMIFSTQCMDAVARESYHRHFQPLPQVLPIVGSDQPYLIFDTHACSFKSAARSSSSLEHCKSKLRAYVLKQEGPPAVIGTLGPWQKAQGPPVVTTTVGPWQKKMIHFDEDSGGNIKHSELTIEQNIEGHPLGITADHWRWYLDYRNSEDTKLYTHTDRSKSFARLKEEELKRQGRRIGRGELWTLTHK
ncbi:hypothetical protein Ahy_A10g049455 isoform C [Arachis hypogaea]|uniref:Uncharacterized protein n=1 Tax=Arachis hypogaea TaxID=3818 RepID=A0A445B773_ARAHY|nr:hypothetical protein Ahy_A10g049455 isoform C [Arachis hypogaea]